MKRIDFPIKPYLLKYLEVHLELKRLETDPLKLEDFVLSSANKQFGLPLSWLLRKSVKSARHEGSNEECTAMLGVDLRNYNFSYYELAQNHLTPYAIFEFNQLVDEIFKKELYWWVRQHRERRATIKDAIRSYMAFYDICEEDIAYETLRKNVQRNGGLPSRKKIKEKGPKTGNFSMNVSQKTSALSQKTSALSQKTSVLSHKATFEAVRQELSKLPLPLFESRFFHNAA
ncbi:hypothetical protein QMK33_19310 [Hymenobacter sp. H14-R3]|uniref:hypothetical protein n=1 Tax=Hymenobacter sp. H14-R3 TaxID=3046308 RepID=UPI0024BB0459|nr:hypothetical protein [Hymenobacter sp. H14-R3]MDJ0367302.1 hypothetical protein [Hymenobacter sp. H14-R3]